MSDPLSAKELEILRYRTFERRMEELDDAFSQWDQETTEQLRQENEE